MLGVLASLTKRARVGPAVTYAFDPSSHHPAWLAKRAVAVDHLSAGRLDLRLAIGPSDAFMHAHWGRYGIRYPSARERLERLEESLAVMRALWSGRPVDHEGRFFRLRGACLTPPPLQRPAPPIWIAAARPRALTT